MRHRLLVIAIALLVSSCGPPYVLVEAKPQTVLSAFTVEPGMPWNRLSGSEGEIEFWTLDGELLNELTFVAGVEGGKPIFPILRQARYSEKGENPLVFRSAMTPPEIEELFRASFAKAWEGVAIAETRNLQPALLGQTQGFRFETRFVGKNEVEFDGVVVGTVRAGKLYLLWFLGARLNYYRRYLPEFERIVASVRFI